MQFVGRFGIAWRQPPPTQSRGVFLSSGLAAYALTADAGAYTLTGQTAGLLVDNALTADTGTYNITGQAASLELGAVLTAETGAYVLTGQDATLTEAGVFDLVCDAGSYTLTGQDVTFTLTPRDCPKLTNSLTATGAMVNSLTADGNMSNRLFPRC